MSDQNLLNIHFQEESFEEDWKAFQKFEKFCNSARELKLVHELCRCPWISEFQKIQNFQMFPTSDFFTKVTSEWVHW